MWNLLTFIHRLMILYYKIITLVIRGIQLLEFSLERKLKGVVAYINVPLRCLYNLHVLL